MEEVTPSNRRPASQVIERLGRGPCAISSLNGVVSLSLSGTCIVAGGYEETFNTIKRSSSAIHIQWYSSQSACAPMGEFGRISVASSKHRCSESFYKSTAIFIPNPNSDVLVVLHLHYMPIFSFELPASLVLSSNVSGPFLPARRYWRSIRWCSLGAYRATPRTTSSRMTTVEFSRHVRPHFGLHRRGRSGVQQVYHGGWKTPWRGFLMRSRHLEQHRCVVHSIGVY